MMTKTSKKCVRCKQVKYKSEFCLNKKVCQECEKQRDEQNKNKYGYRKCTICKRTKVVEEFDYLMKTCKECAKGRKSVIQTKNMNVIHCRYCNEETLNKSRICNKCLDTKKCIRCKQRKQLNCFTNTKVCNECIEVENQIKQQSKLKEIKVICKTCKNEYTILNRFLKKKHFVCEKCKEQKKQFLDSLDGQYVKCKFCNKDFLFITSQHISMCSDHTMTYLQYIEKFGRDSVWSEKYCNLLSMKCKEASERPEVKQKQKEAYNKYFENNKEIVLTRTERMRKSPKRLKNLLENYKNMSEEEHEKRSLASKNSWDNIEIRNNRILGLKSEKSLEARRRNIRICLQKAQPMISKPAQDLFDYLKQSGLDVRLEYPVRFYHLDIALLDSKINIEVDGDWWHGNPKFYPQQNKNQKRRISSDKSKTTYLTNRGWKVLRYYQSDLMQHGFNKVLIDIVSIKETQCLTKNV